MFKSIKNAGKKLINSYNYEKDEIEDLLKSKEKEIEKIKDKNLVLILGNTNSGKSTFINYMIGCKLEEVSEDDDSEDEIKNYQKEDNLEIKNFQIKKQFDDDSFVYISDLNIKKEKDISEIIFDEEILKIEKSNFIKENLKFIKKEENDKISKKKEFENMINENSNNTNKKDISKIKNEKLKKEEIQIEEENLKKEEIQIEEENLKKEHNEQKFETMLSNPIEITTNFMDETLKDSKNIPLESYDTKIRISIKSLIQEQTKIGNSIKSETQGIKYIKDEDNNIFYVDTQGLFDNRKDIDNIAYNYFLFEILKNCRKVKIIVLSSFNELIASGGRNFNDVLGYLEKLFDGYENLEKFKKSIYFCITKKNDKKISFFKKNFKRSNNKLKNLFCDRVFLYNPFDENQKKVLSRFRIIEEIKEMRFMEEKIFKISFTQQDELFMIKKLSNLLKIIKKNLKQENLLNLQRNYNRMKFFKNFNSNLINEKISFIDTEIKYKFKNYENTFKSLCEINEIKKSELVLNKIIFFLKMDDNLFLKELNGKKVKKEEDDYTFFFLGKKNEFIELSKQIENNQDFDLENYKEEIFEKLDVIEQNILNEFRKKKDEEFENRKKNYQKNLDEINLKIKDEKNQRELKYLVDLKKLEIENFQEYIDNFTSELEKDIKNKKTEYIEYRDKIKTLTKIGIISIAASVILSVGFFSMTGIPAPILI